MSRLLYSVLYYTFRVIALIPLSLLYLLSDILYILSYYIIRYRRDIVFENLKNAFPEKKESDIEIIAKQFYRHLCDLVIETIYQTGMGRDEIKKRVKYNNIGIIEKYYREGRHVAAITGHYGNWEWLCGFPLFTGYECITIYRQLKNKVFDTLLFNLRSGFGAKLVPMKMVVRKLYELDREGIPAITAFVADQAPPRAKAFYWVDFLNQDTPVYLGVEQIARKMDMAVVFFRMKKIRRGFYEFDLIPLFDSAASTGDHEITDAHVRELEKQIRENPGCWLWSHRRWKIKRSQ